MTAFMRILCSAWDNNFSFHPFSFSQILSLMRLKDFFFLWPARNGRPKYCSYLWMVEMPKKTEIAFRSLWGVLEPHPTPHNHQNVCCTRWMATSKNSNLSKHKNPNTPWSSSFVSLVWSDHLILHLNEWSYSNHQYIPTTYWVECLSDVAAIENLPS